MIPQDLPPFALNLEFVSGDDFDYPLTLGVPTSGYVFDAYMVVPSGIAPPLGVLSYDVVNPATKLGQVAITLPHDVTATVPAGVYPWQFSFSDAGGLRSTLYQGICTVKSNA
jgi:hypothetical protein